MADPGVVVVGAGAAAVSVVDGLRKHGYEGIATVIGDEAEVPYDRPPLSKQVLAGDWTGERTQLLPGPRLEALGADWIFGERVEALDREARAVTTATGRILEFSELVVATGVQPRRLPNDALEGVHVLRTLADGDRLRGELGPGRKLVIVGAGFLGLEVAATAVKLGVEVDVIEPVEEPLASRLGRQIAARLLALHASRGVRLHTGVSVSALVPDPSGPERVAAVELADGSRFDAHAVLVAIGCAPNVEWLEGSGLDLSDGVVCDEYCSAGPQVWAAGDVARWKHPRLGRHMRLEHRSNASEQGRVVAANILGERTAFSPVPFFWTDHYDVKIQMVGVIPPEAEVSAAVNDLDSDSFVVTFRRRGEDHIVGALGWNAAARMAAFRAEIATHW